MKIHANTKKPLSTNDTPVPPSADALGQLKLSAPHRRLDARQIDFERRSEARLAVDPYETFTLLNDAVNGGETFAGKLALP
jgi:hypothetical protein